MRQSTRARQRNAGARVALKETRTVSRGRFRDWQGPPTAQVPALDTTRLRLRCLKIPDAPAAHQAYEAPLAPCFAQVSRGSRPIYTFADVEVGRVEPIGRGSVRVRI